MLCSSIIINVMTILIMNLNLDSVLLLKKEYLNLLRVTIEVITEDPTIMLLRLLLRYKIDSSSAITAGRDQLELLRIA